MPCLGTKDSPQGTDKTEMASLWGSGREPDRKRCRQMSSPTRILLPVAFPVRLGVNNRLPCFSLGCSSEFSWWGNVTGRQQSCQSSTLSPSVTAPLIKQLFKNRCKKKCACVCVPVLDLMCRGSSEAVTPPSGCISPAPFSAGNSESPVYIKHCNSGASLSAPQPLGCRGAAGQSRPREDQWPDLG